MAKKGQAAMEFLMTYGWAILAILAAIGALAYFGVLTPTKFLPEKCVFPQGMACLDFQVEASDAKFVIQPAFGADAFIYNATIAECDAVFIDRIVDSQLMLNFTNCDNGIEGDQFREKLVVTYSLRGSPIVKQMDADVTTNVR